MLVWDLALGSHLTPEMLGGEHWGVEKDKQLAEFLHLHLGGEEEAIATFW